MKLYVAYVLLESGLGGKILGVRINCFQAQQLCQVEHDHNRGEGNEEQLEWQNYIDRDVSGEQAVCGDVVYYVEETELNLQSRENDVNGMDWKDRRILQLTIDNGRLASDILQQAGMVEPLEARVEQLSRYIDTLLGMLNLNVCNFQNQQPGIDDELWEVKK